MASVSGRLGKFGLAVQSAKGSPESAPTHVYYFREAPTIAPVKAIETMPMTDANRGPAKNFVSRVGVEGDVPIYLNPEGAALLFYGALGANADSGTDPNYIHTITPAADTPYFTMWRMVGGIIFEKYEDCKITSLTLEGTAGQPLSITLSIIGITSTFEAADMTGTPLFCTELLFAESDTFHKIATVERPIDRLTWGINNNHAGWQPNSYRFADIDPGGRDYTLDFGVRLSDDDEYREHYYGSASGTDQALTQVEKAWEIEFRRTTNLSVKIGHAVTTFREYPVQPDPAGDPIGVAVSAAVERGDTVAEECTVVVRDANETVG